MLRREKGMKPAWRLRDVTLSDLRKRKHEVAVLPFGAIEPHNLHLPYGTDCFEAEEISARACEMASKKGARVVLLPTIPFGSNRSTMKFPLTINLDHSTLATIIRDVAESLASHRIFKLVLVNGHGGNNLRHILKDLYGKTKVFISLINWWQVGTELRARLFEQKGDHADEMETSVMLYLRPELVDLEKADAGPVRKSKLRAVNEGWVYIVRPWEIVTTNSGYGDPRKATAAKGKQYVDFTVQKIADYLIELSKTPLTKTFPY